MYELIQSRLEKQQTILLDGGLGSELVRRGVRWRKHGLLSDESAIRQLHEDYLEAGADVLRTNTFQLNERVYLNVFHDRDHMRHIGAPGLGELVRQARVRRESERRVAIAGVLSPLEHCYRPDLAPQAEECREEHEGLANLFAEEGVDFLLLESMHTIEEARVALAAGRSAGLPVWVSFVLGPEGNLLSREPIETAVAAMEDEGASAILVNCAPPEDVTKALERVKGSCSTHFGGFAHIGRFSPPSWKFEFFPQFIETEQWPPERYKAEAKRWRDHGATILGGCCGTSPAHISVLRDWLSTP